jgi:hypothetical protein
LKLGRLLIRFLCWLRIKSQLRKPKNGMDRY